MSNNKQTPIQELIEQLKELQDTQDPYGLHDAIELAESYIKREKKVMKSCIMMGLEFIPVDPNKYNEDAEYLYNETFNTKEK